MNYQDFLNDRNPKVLFTIKDFGQIEAEIFVDVAPKTAKNFLDLVKSNFYNGLTFHRVIKGFMIQGGDPLGNGTGTAKMSIFGEFANNGFANPLQHSRGVLSMARSFLPDSASCQFFIMHQDAAYLDGAYAAFGVVTKGIEVVDKIAEVETNYHDKPLKPVIIEKVEIL